MKNLIIRPRTLDDDPQIVAIWNHLSPPFPSTTLEELRYGEGISRLLPEAQYERWVAEHNGEIVGTLSLEKMWWSTKPGGYVANIMVDPEQWGQGIGNRLYDLLCERMNELGATRLYGYVREDRPHVLHFIEKRGFTYTGRSEHKSRLNVHEANLEGYEGLVDRLHAEGIHIVTLAEIGLENESFLHALHEMSIATARDVPSSEELDSWPYELWYHEITRPGMSPEWMWVAIADDRPVGLAFLLRKGENAAFNEYTAVDRAYRGRGIARALKLQTIEWARQNGIDFIYTSNDVANQRMLAINIRLGYQPLPSTSEVVKHLTNPTETQGSM
jgi:GNAT superfamily N-acetyltransferase